MTALAADAIRSNALHDAQMVGLPIKLNTTVYRGGYVCADANGYAVPLSDVAGLKPMGVAQNGLASGAAGSISTTDPLKADRYIQVDRRGPWSFAVTGATPKPGETAYGRDDNTVSTVAGTNVMVIGTFLYPNPVGGAGHWMVDFVAPL
jgi:hypothetical protein